MRPKILKSYTIIPPELYVNRAADRQVEQILDDMGRPGYVLVARQMGKTNLLLNARRKYRSMGDVFAYIDASNQIPSIREFLRGIVDTILAQDDKIFAPAQFSIAKRRVEIDMLPHREHEAELAIILKIIEGRLVICLDEIDALVSSPYSDQLFSFIRSVYFSGRSNFENFHRLTYILSGVAEPADLIKNSSVSPFNIGENIYLDDFALEEVEEFFQKAQLMLSPVVKEQIFAWTNGHPRMTWDVASAVEDELRVGKVLAPNDVDNIVRKMYFSDVNMPPVDHIKRTVQEQHDIRDALISIHYGRSEAVSDSLRTKLYLAGISRLELVNKNVSFKNRILKEALSENYLAKLGSSPFDVLMKKIDRYFVSGEYKLAVFELEALLSAPIDLKQKAVASLWLARCFFRLEEYEECIKRIEAIDVENVEESHLWYFYLGTALYRIGQYENARGNLAQAVAIWHKNTGNSLDEAIVDLAYCNLELQNVEANDIITECNDVIARRGQISNAASVERTPVSILVKAHVAIARAWLLQRELEHAWSALETAERLAVEGTKVRVQIFQMTIASYGSPRYKLELENALSEILKIDKFTLIDDGSDDGLDLSPSFDLLVELDRRGRSNDFQIVLNHISRSVADGVDIGGVLKYLVDKAISCDDFKLALRFIEKIGSIAEVDLNSKKEVIGHLLNVDLASAFTYAEEYLALFCSPGVSLMLEDFRPLTAAYVASRARHNFTACRKAVELLHRNPEDMNEGKMQDIFLLREFIGVSEEIEVDSNANATINAQNFFDKLQKSKRFPSSFLPSWCH